MISRDILMQFAGLQVLLLMSFTAAAQATNQLTLEDCYTLARKNYPVIKQSELLEKTRDYTIENLSKGNLPQFSINGQATYQSEVTSFPVSLPNVKIPELSKDQYKLYGEINQPLTDRYSINLQKQLAEVSTGAQLQQVEVELFRLKDRINQLYFGILLANEQLRQNQLLKNDIQSGLDKVNAGIANGTSLKSNGQLLQAELLKTIQHEIEIKAGRRSFAGMLGVFIGMAISDDTPLQTPPTIMATNNINRPELKMYDLQSKQFVVQQKLADTRKIPKISLFAQGGIGRPALNFLSNDVKGYYIAGLRFNWNLTSFYTLKHDKDILAISRKNIDVQKETFLFNTNITLTQQASEIEKYRQLLNTDNEIIALRLKVKTAALAQLENGVITAIDFLGYVNAEDQSRQAMALHNAQLLLAQYNYQNTTGN